MRTEVSKAFNWGFLLSEQELRRTFTACREHAEKLGGTPDPEISVKLKDGSLVEVKDLDQVLSLENAGSKAIKRLSMAFEGGADRNQWQIKVDFLDGFSNTENWNSIRFQVVGASRDLVFLAAAELEERLKKTRIVSWPYLASRRWFSSLIPILVILVVMPLFVNNLDTETDALSQLEEAYQGGSVENATEALIFFERAKQEGRGFRTSLMLGGIVVVPLVIVIGSGYVLSWLFPAYNFYLGDYVAYYDKRRSVSRIVWGVFFLGIIASLIAGLMLQQL